MKKSKEQIIGIVLFIGALAAFGISFWATLVPALNFSAGKICMYLGFACFGLGLVFGNKAKEQNNSKEK